MSKAGDARLNDLLSKTEETTGAAKKVCFIGYPCDEGVKRNKGRLGAKEGPNAFRACVYKTGPLVNPENGADLTEMDIRDKGDVEIAKTLEETHQNLETAVKNLLMDKYIPVVIGGGNDQSYPNFRALCQAFKEESDGHFGVINIDAHLDVRPLLDGNLASSGTPFRQMLEDPKYKGSFIEFACQGSQCSSQHANYVKEKGGKIVWLSEIRGSSQSAATTFNDCVEFFEHQNIFVSFDIDSIRSADCPGVSCPATVGLSSEDALEICFQAGKNPKVRLMDISEFNPLIEGDRTARLVAQMFYHFSMGVSKRK